MGALMAGDTHEFEELLQAAAAGDAEGWRELLDRVGERLRRMVVTTNRIQHEFGGAGGSGRRPGARGTNSVGFGGGVFIADSAAAGATKNTQIHGNRADVDGTIAII